MSQQALDLRRSMQIVRRHKILVGIVVALGILAGAAYAVLKPPMLTSTALIALPVSRACSRQPAPARPDPFTATQEVVAGSYPVLLGALPDIHPAMPFNELRHNVEVGSPSPNIISITAKGKNATEAESATNAVANSYISYVGSSRSAVGRVQAHLLASASSATGPSPIERMIIYALLGGLVGVLIGVIVALAIGRNDRRLRQRDEIANSIGIPVLASVPVGSSLLRQGLDEASRELQAGRRALLAAAYGPAAAGDGRPWLRPHRDKTVTAVPRTTTTAPPCTMTAAPRWRCCPSPRIPTLSPWDRNWPSSPPPREFRRCSSSARSRTQPPRPRCAPRALAVVRGTGTRRPAANHRL